MFFFWYYYHSEPWETLRRLSPFERRWYIERFIEQKDKENREIEKAHKGK